MTVADRPVAEMGPILCRAAAVVDAVRYAERIVDVIAVPYGTATTVEHRGRWIRESIAPHAFADEAGTARKRPVYREHDYARQVGIVAGLVDGDDALRASLRIGSGALGDETLAWADEGLLDASIGFAAAPTDQAWSADRKARTIMRGFIEHVALVAMPAYPGARVLAVRHRDRAASGRVPTPNLDAIRNARLTILAHLPAVPESE